MKNLFILFMCSLFSITCSQKKLDENILCKNFYELNKSKQFEVFFDIQIGFGRMRSKYNEQSMRYRILFKDISVYNSVLNEYVTIPIFNKTANVAEKKMAFDRCSKKAKQVLKIKFGNKTPQSLFAVYNNYITNILDCYDQISIPSSLPYENIIIDGNPTLGKFITFTLTEKSKCYYVKDEKSLTPYWLAYLNTSHKLDNHWYYSKTP